jgi:hypothetical protein
MDAETVEKTSTKALAPPYLSWKTFSGYLKSLAQGIPDPIDPSGMLTLNGSNRRLVMNALRYLKLVDGKDYKAKELQPLVEAMAKEDANQKKTSLRAMLEKAYPFLFQGFDLGTSTPAAFGKKFSEAGLGGQTVAKGEAFFIEAAKEAGVTISPYILGSRKKGPKPGSGPSIPRIKKKSPELNLGSGEHGEGGGSETDVRGVMAGTLASKFPDFDPTWSQDAQEAWFKMYGRLLSLVEPDADAEE